MKKRLTTIFVLSCLIITIFYPVCCNSNSISIKIKNDLQNMNLIEINNQECLYNEIIIKFVPDITIKISHNTKGYVSTGIESVDKLNEKYQIIDVVELFLNNPTIVLKNIYKFKFISNKDIQDIIQEYTQNPLVLYAEPNNVYHFCEIPNDPYFNQQWSLDHTRDFDIDAPEAWDIKNGDSNVIIAIVDSGVDYNHSDLADNIWINEAEDINGNGRFDNWPYWKKIDGVYGDIDYIDNDGNGFIDDVIGWNFYDENNDPMDLIDHGTHCAGIAGAVSNNSLGVAGVCWNCKLMTVRIGGPSIYEDDAANGIVYATDNGADIISMSWGGMMSSSLIQDAINYSYNNGVCLIAAAGNEGLEITLFPALLDKVMAVAATDASGNKCEWSNYGNLTDVAAPGDNIFSTISFNKYCYYSGTSMSTPHVSGLAALLLSKDPLLTFTQIRKMINQSADRLPPSEKNYVGAGKINAYEALITGPGPAKARIDFPIHGDDISEFCGIVGSAWGKGFQYYRLEYCLGVIPHFSDNWIELINSTTQKYNENLGFINTTNLDDLGYRLRLTVVCNNGFYKDTIWIVIDNFKSIIYADDDNTLGPWYGTIDYPYNLIEDAFFATAVNDTVFVKSGEYLGKINIWKSLKLIGENKNNTIIHATDLDEGFILTADHVNLTGFSIINSKYDGVKIISRYNNVFNNIIYPHSYNGVRVKNSYNNIFENTISYTKNYFCGIKVIEASYVGINNNHMQKNCGGFAIHIYKSNNIIINNNTLFENSLKLEGNELSHWNTHTIKDNTFNNKPIRYYKNAENIIVPSDTAQLIFANCNNCQITNLFLSDHYNSATIQIAFSNNIDIINNSFYNSSFGVYFFKSSDNKIFDNYMDKVSKCLYLYSSSDNQINNNSFRMCTQGIFLDENSNNNYISNITINNKGGIALFFSSSHFNKVKDCQFINCTYGYFSSISSNNIFTYCNFTGCWYAIWSFTVTEKNNVFHHNNFVNNDNNKPYFVNDNNYWDDGKEGNFWDDYIGLKYPLIFDKNRDGIGDVPYFVDKINNIDHYPLMYQVGGKSHSRNLVQVRFRNIFPFLHLRNHLQKIIEIFSLIKDKLLPHQL